MISVRAAVAFILALYLFAKTELAFAVNYQHVTDTGIIADGATPQLIARTFAFTEGPAADKQGNIYFTDQPNNKIWKYSTDGRLSVFMDSAGRSNGLYIDKKGNLYSCADEKNQLWMIDAHRKITVLINDLNGKKLNGPNDLWVSPRGDIYFTDPYYQRSWWERTKPEIEREKVYVWLRGSRKVVPVVDTLQRPNGIAGTADGRYLYVSDLQGGKTYRYTINKDGALSEAKLFANMGSDGMTTDNQGNVYLTGRGVTVFNSRGVQIAHIAIPEGWTANVAFGGKKKNKLFITASEAIYTLDMKVKGVE
ncbi:SMP-30/gluconolactonase/LRE family protein [Chitinophaga filiformis]|uniref:SMP-30/gluconolactonase/LRE family protein n=1 Tax=Chitinophaga filiformis TaxID=104663 RepID=UPI001F2D532F|nr:SMP-30/gluconolactonase/LRE family protein [Chitinophaga filiformis]MCF6405491.1 SMP-30/gluconolactonase/LRE family protein [Chitinophaga filiformis]